MAPKILQKQDFSTEDEYCTHDLLAGEATVGALLKKARLEKKQEISEVSSSLRVSERYLRAIEDNTQSLLPEQVYTLGFVRSYAHYLGFEASEIVEQYKRENLPPAKIHTLPFPQPASGFGIPKLWIVISAAALLIFGYIFWFIISAHQQPNLKQSEIISEGAGELTPSAFEELDLIDETIPDQKKEAVKEKDNLAQLNINPEKENTLSLTRPETEANENTASLKPSAKADPSSRSDKMVQEEAESLAYKDLIFEAGQKFTIQASTLSWVGILDKKGQMIINRNLQPNSMLEVEAQPGMKFSTGNAGGLRFSVEGKTTEPLGKEGEILRNVPLRFKEQN